MYNNNFNAFTNRMPEAIAYIKGSKEYPMIKGRAEFFSERDGVMVFTEVYGLPADAERPFRVFAYHIHEGDSCTGNETDPFANAKEHYNPANKPHPYHAGDLPPLFSNYGYAKGSVLTARFKLSEVIGRVIIIHSDPDDFTTQPSGAAGSKIACGIIERARQ